MNTDHLVKQLPGDLFRSLVGQRRRHCVAATHVDTIQNITVISRSPLYWAY